MWNSSQISVDLVTFTKKSLIKNFMFLLSCSVCLKNIWNSGGVHPSSACNDPAWRKLNDSNNWLSENTSVQIKLLFTILLTNITSASHCCKHRHATGWTWTFALLINTRPRCYLLPILLILAKETTHIKK